LFFYCLLYLNSFCHSSYAKVPIQQQAIAFNDSLPAKEIDASMLRKENSIPQLCRDIFGSDATLQRCATQQIRRLLSAGTHIVPAYKYNAHVFLLNCF
jgi:hypothetical protein